MSDIAVARKGKVYIDGNAASATYLANSINNMQAKINHLREAWLTEQKGRLDQTELVETYSAVKSRAEINRLRTTLSGAYTLLTVVVDDLREAAKAGGE